MGEGMGGGGGQEGIGCGGGWAAEGGLYRSIGLLEYL